MTKYLSFLSVEDKTSSGLAGGSRFLFRSASGNSQESKARLPSAPSLSYKDFINGSESFLTFLRDLKSRMQSRSMIISQDI